MDLVDDPVALRRRLRRPDFVYVPEGTAQKSTLLEVGESTGDVEQESILEGEEEALRKRLAPQTIRSLIYSVQKAQSELDVMLVAARKPLTRRRRCWEVFVGCGRVSEKLREVGCEVEQIGLENDWHLTDPEHQAAFLRKMTTRPRTTFGCRRCVVLGRRFSS